MSAVVIELPFDVPLLPVEKLKAGAISCWYEKGNLRYISSAGEEVIRLIYPAIRSKSWDTAPYEIEEENKQILERSFEISYTARYRLDEIQYKARITITGREDSSISFVMKGEAVSTFETNRIGLCVNHPIETCKGRKVIITRPDKSTYHAVYPDQISPRQPFKNISEMAWRTDQNNSVHLVFEGDIFETEDQRNWNDNSYKTYSTPLELSAPFLIAQGSTMEQRIELSVIKKSNLINQQIRDGPETNEKKINVPKIGYSRIPGSGPLTSMQITALKNLPFDHYRVELFMTALDWEHELSNACIEAEKLDAMLELVVFFNNSFEAEFSRLLLQLGKHKDKINTLLPLHIDSDVTPVTLIKNIYGKLKKLIPNIAIGYGTNGSFAELNRSHPVDPEFDFVSFSMNPQVHATDTRSIIENLESQRQTISTIRLFTLKPIHISPVTFNQRTKHSPDPRLLTYFGAAWTLMSLRNFCEAGSLTFYQTNGEMGILDSFHSTKKIDSKIYEVLAQVKEFRPSYLVLDGISTNITFENTSGDRLTYSVDKTFLVQ
jgi:hypothetical protein